VTKTMLTFVNLLPILMVSFMPCLLQVESLAPPYIRLKAVLDEPNGFGYGIDLPGFGPTLSFQNIRAHTLKPTGKNDSDMKQDFVNGTIRFFEDGDGHCLEAVQATKGSSLNAPSCDSQQILQMWDIGKDDTIRLTKFPFLCLTVEGEIGRAGPWWKKDLKMNPCEAVDKDLKRWEVHSNGTDVDEDLNRWDRWDHNNGAWEDHNNGAWEVHNNGADGMEMKKMWWIVVSVVMYRYIC